MRFATIFIAIVLFMPFIGLLLYIAVYPEESALWGMRWRFRNEDLEPSDEIIKYNRIMAIVMLIIAIVILIATIFRA